MTQNSTINAALTLVKRKTKPKPKDLKNENKNNDSNRVTLGIQLD